MSEKIKVTFFKNVGRFTEGQEIECTPDEAEQYCAPRERNDGTNVVKFQCAIRSKDLEKLKLIPPERGGLSLDEARALGVKNVQSDPDKNILPNRLRGVPTSDQASFQEEKSPDEGKSAKDAAAINAANPASKKRHA